MPPPRAVAMLSIFAQVVEPPVGASMNVPVWVTVLVAPAILGLGAFIQKLYNDRQANKGVERTDVISRLEKQINDLRDRVRFLEESEGRCEKERIDLKVKCENYRIGLVYFHQLCKAKAVEFIKWLKDDELVLIPAGGQPAAPSPAKDADHDH